jgi:hypothetical protein
LFNKVMLGLFFPSRRKAKQQQEEPPQGNTKPCSSTKHSLGPNSCHMKKQHAAARHDKAGTAAAATAAATAATTTAAASPSASAPSHHHHHHHPHHHHHDHAPAEAALLDDLATARKALEAAGEAEAAGGTVAIAKAVESIAELRGRWRAYGSANLAAAAGGAAAAKTRSSSSRSTATTPPLTAKEKLELNELGLRAQLALDGVETGGRADVRALRKRATVCAEAFLDEVQAAPEAAARPTPPPSPRG